MALSSDGKHLVCGRTVWDTENLKLECFADGRRLWKDYGEWRRIHVVEGGRPVEKSAAVMSTFAWCYKGCLTPDNRRLVVAGLYGLRGPSGTGLTAEGRKLLRLRTATGRALRTGSESLLSVFDVVTGDLLLEDQVFSNGASVFAINVSRDGRYALAAGSGDGVPSRGAPVLPPDPWQLFLYKLPPLSASRPPAAETHADGAGAPGK